MRNARPAGSPGAADAPRTADYFVRLRGPLRAGLLIACLVPLGILSIFFHLQYNQTLKKNGKLHLTNLAESQSNTIDLVLQERVVNLFGLFHRTDFGLTPSAEEMTRYLDHLKRDSDAFFDLGLIDGSGVEVGHAGPFLRLKGKDYGAEGWYRDLTRRDQTYFISDIEIGPGREPYFIIAVQQQVDTKHVVLNATLDAAKVFSFVHIIGRSQGVESFIVSDEGRYQFVNADLGRPQEKSGIDVDTLDARGAFESDTPRGRSLVAYTRLAEVPWTLIVEQPVRVAYAEMYRARRIMLATIAVLVIVIVAAVWWTTDRVLRRAHSIEQSRAELRSQLIHAGKLASVGELAAGVAHEINNPLAIISAESNVIRDYLDPQFGVNPSPETIRDELDVIDTAVARARTITHKLLNFTRRSEPSLAPRDMNRLMDDLVSGLLENELQARSITLVKEYASELPEVLIDLDQIRQVFLNLVKNAADAITGAGTITLATSVDGEWVRASVRDTGNGISPDRMGSIFRPFFTTKEAGKGTGLGLSISLNIVQELGGRIEVDSMVGSGTTFTVVLPRVQAGRPDNGAAEHGPAARGRRIAARPLETP